MQGLRFLTFPYLLTMQLKRFDFDYTTMHRIKLNDRSALLLLQSSLPIVVILPPLPILWAAGGIVFSTCPPSVHACMHVRLRARGISRVAYLQLLVLVKRVIVDFTAE